MNAEPPNPPDEPPTATPAEIAIEPAEQAADLPANQGVGQAYLLVAICTCLIASVGAAAQLWRPYLGVVIVEVFFVLLPAVAFVARRRQPIAASLGWRSISPALAVTSVAIGASCAGIMILIQFLQIPFVGQPPEQDLFESFAYLGSTLRGLVCVSVLPGICEETLFRGAVLGVLRRRGPSTSVLMTALLFALFHANRWNLASPFFAGIVFGILTFRSGSTIPAMLAHASANATLLVVFWSRERYPPTVGSLIIAALAGTFVVISAIYLGRTKNQASEPGPLASVPAGLSGPAMAATIIGAVLFVGMADFVVQNWIGGHYVTRDEHVPGLEPGDLVYLLKGPLADVGLRVGEIVEVGSDPSPRLGKIDRFGRKGFWLAGWPETIVFSKREIIGRAIYIRRREP